MVIRKAIKSIIDVFIRNHFRPLTYKAIADRLQETPNTIMQRIKRNPKYFNIDDETRPFKVTLKPENDEIIFIRDRNQCHICRRTLNPDLLVRRYKNPDLRDKDAWQNIITCCQDCKDKDISKSILKKSKQVMKLKPSKRPVWEYHEIRIRNVISSTNIYTYPLWEADTPVYIAGYEDYPMTRSQLASSLANQESESYYEYDELNGKGWYHLTEEGKPSSKTIKDILDYFGYDGWELVSISQIVKSFKTDVIGWPNIPYQSEPEEYHCIFKRKRKEAHKNGD